MPCPDQVSPGDAYLSISVLEQVSTRGWGGKEEPSLPIGSWFFRSTLTGDGSAGSKTLEMSFSIAATGSPLDANSYSLEQLAIHETAAAGQVAFLIAVQLGTVSAATVAPFKFAYAITLDALVTGSGSAARALDIGAVRGLFLGQPETAEASATLGVRVANVDTEVLTLAGQGYIWGPRSLSTPGGPIRPSPGLYV